MVDEPGADEAFCQHCGDSIKKRAEICPNCGVRNDKSIATQSTEGYCRSCGEAIKNEAEICPNCGVKNGNTSDSSSSSFQIDADVLYAVTTAFGVLFILAGFGAVSEGTIGGGLTYLIIGLVLLPQVRRQFSRDHSITTLGYVSSVEETIVREQSVPCGACQSSVGEGVRRVYNRQFVLFGVPLFTLEEGENTYCKPCANGEVVEVDTTIQE